MSYGGHFGQETTQPPDEAERGLERSGRTIAPGVTGPSGTTSATLAFPVSDSAVRPVSSSENERIDTLKNLERAIDSFRSKDTSKTTAISSILRILGEVTDVSLTQSQKDSTFDSYLNEILSIQSSFEDTRAHEDLNSGSSGPTLSTPAEDSPPSQGLKKIREVSDSEDESDGAKHPKRQKLVESDMPWYSNSSEPSSGSGNPSCVETCRLLRAYNRDVARAKFLIKIAPNSPSGIPSSQWERILKGDAVDLNQIFTSLHYIVPDEERTGRLGETEISFGIAEPKKRISSASEWSAAWRRASKAISFAFPHRRDELFEYGDYIEAEFAAKVVSSHHKVLLYDAALRNEVAAGQHVLLTDHYRFSRLYSAIVMPDGVESSADKTFGRKSTKPDKRSREGGRPEICNKFNAGTCKLASSDCKYRHLCKNCNQPGHGRKDCPDGSK
jgi:hypothetical protein